MYKGILCISTVITYVAENVEEMRKEIFNFSFNQYRVNTLTLSRLVLQPFESSSNLYAISINEYQANDPNFISQIFSQ